MPKPRAVGDQRRMAEHEADQQRLLLAGAGLGGAAAGRGVGQRHVGPVGAAVRCCRPRHRGRDRRRGWRAASPRPPAPGRPPAARRSGRRRRSGRWGRGPWRPAASAALSRAARPDRAAVTATAWRAIASSSPASQAASAPPRASSRLRAATAVVVRRDLARVAGLQRPDQPVEEAAAAGGALQEQPVHLRREPDGRHAAPRSRLAARRAAVQPEGAALGGAVRRGAGADVAAGLPRS